MDIGDVSLPLPKIVVDAICEASQEMGESATFHGYGPEQGYKFLRDVIAKNDYSDRGIVSINADDIFISDGAKSDLGNLGDLFGPDMKIAVADPGYPVYVDANVLAGRGGDLVDGRWSGLVYLDCSPENDFLPSLPEEDIDIVYLCYPNNPTGAAMTRQQLKVWVDYAIEHKTLLIFDSAYEAYVSSPEIVRSIYEIEGAEKVAIEIRSFSKTAGFTGVRCGYTVVPSSLDFNYPDNTPASLNKMWNRRQSTKFNGVGYIIQKGAQSLYTPEGKAQIRRNIEYYMNNARMLRNALLGKGWKVVGGLNSPYVWACPNPEGKFIKGSSIDSWKLFEKLLNELQISTTPGSGFGNSGEGWIRLTGFNTFENTQSAIERLKNWELLNS